MTRIVTCGNMREMKKLRLKYGASPPALSLEEEEEEEG
jgi:hypothetical protein